MGNRITTIGQRAFRGLLLAQILPTLALLPAHAGAVLFHSHCEEPRHFHVLPEAQLTNWTDVDAPWHFGGGAEPVVCCAAGESHSDHEGVVLQRIPMLVCRARTIEPVALQPVLNAAPPQVVSTCILSFSDRPGAARGADPPYRCLDKLVSSSHALLI